MLRGEAPVLEGVQRMLPYRWTTGVDEWDEDFLTFVAIQSHEDHLPVGPVRAHWHPDALLRLEPEFRAAEDCHRPAALRACESLIRRFTAPTAPVLQSLYAPPADSDLLRVPEPLAIRSLSNREVVLPYPEVLDAIDQLEAGGCDLLGWEGWLRFSDGHAGHSARHQGTTDLGLVARAEAFHSCRETIEEAQREWEARAEVAGASLYFCLSLSPTR